MGERTTEQAALTVMTVVQVPNFWDAFLPPLGAMAHDGPYSRASIRKGEMNALALSLAFGIAASALVQEPWPLLGVAVICAYMLYSYEQALSACGPPAPVDLAKPAPQDANRWSAS